MMSLGVVLEECWLSASFQAHLPKMEIENALDDPVPEVRVDDV
jgi:hypothetical protein